MPFMPCVGARVYVLARLCAVSSEASTAQRYAPINQRLSAQGCARPVATALARAANDWRTRYMVGTCRGRSRPIGALVWLIHDASATLSVTLKRSSDFAQRKRPAKSRESRLESFEAP
jgi:hypothetical protein